LSKNIWRKKPDLCAARITIRHAKCASTSTCCYLTRFANGRLLQITSSNIGDIFTSSNSGEKGKMRMNVKSEREQRLTPPRASH
jgi:hypothetical protein